MEKGKYYMTIGTSYLTIGWSLEIVRVKKCESLKILPYWHVNKLAY
jgi:hypothetical protein